MFFDRQFGFIRRADGASVFFHKRSLIYPSAFDGLYEGERLRFTTIETSRGLRAESVVVLGDESR